jgi:hypothetical protein
VGVRCGVCGGKCHGKVDRCGGAGESVTQGEEGVAGEEVEKVPT